MYTKIFSYDDGQTMDNYERLKFLLADAMREFPELAITLQPIYTFAVNRFHDYRRDYIAQFKNN
jgi:hypothetical protein